MTTIHMKVRRFAMPLQYATIALVLLNVSPSCMQAQDSHSHSATAEPEMTLEQQAAASTLLKVVRDATERFKDVTVARRKGMRSIRLRDRRRLRGHGAALCQWKPGEQRRSGRHSSPDRDLRADADRRPETDRRRLSGYRRHVACDAHGSAAADGTALSFVPGPNRFGLPAFYTLHVWAWKENPKGAFVNWHPNVSCASFASQ